MPRTQYGLEHNEFTDPIKCFYTPDSSGNMGHALVISTSAASNSEAGYHKACLWIDITNKTFKYNNGTISSTTWANVDSSSAGSVDAAFDVGKVIDGASSQANGFRVGDGTDYLGIYALSAGNTVHIEANSGSTIELDPDAASGTGTVNVNGAMVVDSNLSVGGNLTVTGIISGALTAGTSGTSDDVTIHTDTAGDEWTFDTTNKFLVCDDVGIHMQDNDTIELGTGSGTGTGDFRFYSDGSHAYLIANADSDGASFKIGDDTNAIDLVWEGDTNNAIVTFDHSADQVYVNGVTLRMGDSDQIQLGDGATSNGDFKLYSDGTHVYLAACANSDGATFYLGDDTNALDVVWEGTTNGAVVTFDHSGDSVAFTNVTQSISDDTAFTDNNAALSVTGTGNIGAGGNVFRAAFTTGSPNAGAILAELAGAGKDLIGLSADVDGATNDVYSFNSGGAIATGKSILKVTGDGTPAAADSYLAYFDYSGMTSTNNPAAVKIKSKGTAHQLEIESTDTGATGARILGKHTSTGSAAANDAVFVIDAYGLDAGDASTLYAKIEGEIMTATAGQEDGRWVFSAAANDSTLTQMLTLNPRAGGSLAEAVIGSGAGNAYLTTSGAYDLILDTNQGTDSGNITITDAANGNITLTPNGTGDVVLAADTVTCGDSGSDVTIASNGEADVIIQTGSATTGNLRLYDGANGALVFTPNGTGYFRVVGGALADDAVGVYNPVVFRYAWQNDDPDGNNDLTIAIPFKCTIVDVWMQVTTPEGGAMTATLRSAAAGGGNAISSALNCNDVSLVRSTALTANEDIAAGNIYCNFSGNPGTCVGTLYIQAIPTA